MNRLDDAIKRQQAVQRSRALAWILFAAALTISLLVWIEVIFGFLNFDDISMLQLSAEVILALLLGFAATQMFRKGLRLNRLLADPARLLSTSEEDFNALLFRFRPPK